MLHQSLAIPTWPRHIFGGDATDVAASIRPTAAATEATSKAPSSAEAVWQTVAAGVECRALVQGPEMAMAQVRFRRGATLSVHAHRGSQGGYVLQGKLLITLATEQITVAAGQVYQLPAGAPHQIRAVEKSVVIEMYAPGATAATEIASVVGGIGDAAQPPAPVAIRRTRRPADAFPGGPSRSARRPRTPRAPSICQPLARPGDAA